MIYFISLFTSLIIQFGALTLPITTIDTLPEGAINSGFDYMLSSGGIWAYYCDTKLSNQDIFIFYRDDGSYYAIYYIVPITPYNSSISSSFSVSSYSYLNSDNTLQFDISYSHYARYVYYYYKSGSGHFGAPESSDFSGSFYTPKYPNNNGGLILSYNTSIISYNDVVLFYPNNYVIPDTDLGLGLGSLSGAGHSSGNSPFDELNNNGVNWSGSVSGYVLTGHSYSNVTPAQVDSSSKEQNLLQQIINNISYILQNSGKIGESLNSINNNVIQSASALYNAISGFNDNFVSAFSSPDKEEINALLQTSEIYVCYNGVISSVSSMVATLDNVGQQNNYIWSFSLPELWGGELSFDFSEYVDSGSLDSVRSLIGALLIVSTIIFVAHQFPDIIGGGSGGENA